MSVGFDTSKALAIMEKSGGDAGEQDGTVALRLSIRERIEDCRRKKERLLQAVELLKDVPVKERHHLDNTVEGCLYIEQCAWQDFVADTGIMSAMSIKARESLRNQLYQTGYNRTPLPPFDEANVFGFFDQTFSNIEQMIQEAIKEVFDWLTPRRMNHKTNDSFRIGDKVVISYGCESNWRGGFRTNYHSDARFDALGNVLSMLDGKGIEKHPNVLSRRLSASWEKAEHYEDAYLYAKPFKNQNVHIRFKRPDLVEKINAASGEMVLRDKAREESRGFSH